MSRPFRVALVTALVGGAVALSQLAAAVPSPGPDEATLAVTRASCADATAFAKIRTTVTELPDADFYYLLGRTRLESRQTGGNWQPVAKRFAISRGFSKDDGLPQRWNMKLSTEVPGALLDQQLSVRYRVELMRGDELIWRARGRTPAFVCGSA